MAQSWVVAQDFIDSMLRPFETLLVEEISTIKPKSVLDVGCGNGGTTLAIHTALGGDARCVGIDVSAPMIANAKRRALAATLQAEFVCADASDWVAAGAPFELIASRFGVMFFADAVAAFRRLRQNAAPNADLALVVWRGPDENAFLTAAQRTAEPLLPPLPPRDPASPGPFALADPDHVRSVLVSSGWSDIECRPHDVPCAFPAADLDFFLRELVPLGCDVDAIDAERLAAIRRAIRDSYEQFIDQNLVRFTGHCWLIRARADQSTSLGQ
ncbi:MAG: methyltransferase domain-containing protein [Pseudomonadota bacterium]